MISNQLTDVCSARLGSDAVLRHDSVALLSADGYLLSQEKSVLGASWRSWQGERPNADFFLAGAMFGRVGADSFGRSADAKGGKRIDAVKGAHIADVHVTDTTTFPTSLGPPPSCLPV